MIICPQNPYFLNDYFVNGFCKESFKYSLVAFSVCHFIWLSKIIYKNSLKTLKENINGKGILNCLFSLLYVKKERYLHVSETYSSQTSIFKNRRIHDLILVTTSNCCFWRNTYISSFRSKILSWNIRIVVRWENDHRASSPSAP